MITFLNAQDIKYFFVQKLLSGRLFSIKWSLFKTNIYIQCKNLKNVSEEQMCTYYFCNIAVTRKWLVSPLIVGELALVSAVAGLCRSSAAGGDLPALAGAVAGLCRCRSSPAGGDLPALASEVAGLCRCPSSPTGAPDNCCFLAPAADEK